MEPYMENAEIEKTQEDEKFTKIKALAKEAYVLNLVLSTRNVKW